MGRWRCNQCSDACTIEQDYDFHKPPKGCLFDDTYTKWRWEPVEPEPDNLDRALVMLAKVPEQRGSGSVPSIEIFSDGSGYIRYHQEKTAGWNNLDEMFEVLEKHQRPQRQQDEEDLRAMRRYVDHTRELGCEDKARAVRLMDRFEEEVLKKEDGK